MNTLKLQELSSIAKSLYISLPNGVAIGQIKTTANGLLLIHDILEQEVVRKPNTNYVNTQQLSSEAKNLLISLNNGNTPAIGQIKLIYECFRTILDILSYEVVRVGDKQTVSATKQRFSNAEGDTTPTCKMDVFKIGIVIGMVVLAYVAGHNKMLSKLF